ncbi:MAG: hypothetical protein RBS24_03305 [Bacilli bacterium]|jgi:DNA-directed RNA polymerase specialized sigma24 family protein|nr:hypothetical protein [Bacilli bacterium]
MRLHKFISNEQAFRALVAGNKEAKYILLANFDHYIKAKAGQHIITNVDHGLDFNELVLVGKSALTNAIHTYRGNVESFASYATVVIQNAMANYMKQYRSPTARITRFGISLDDYLFDDNMTLLVSDSIAEVQNPDDLGFYEATSIGYFEDLLPIGLEKEEIIVIREKLLGFSYQEIQKKLNMPKRKLDTLICKIKDKFKRKK